MKTYEKYLITEANTVTKKISSIRKKFKDASTPIEYKAAVSTLTAFIKRHKDAYTAEIAEELRNLMDAAKKRVS